MNRVVRTAAKVVGGLLLAGLLLVGTAFAVGNGRLNDTHERVGHALAVPTDSASIATGERLTWAYGCRDCHAEDLGGQIMIEDAAFATLPAPNLTRGEGGIGSAYTLDDWERSIRHGVGPDGRTLFIMPSGSYAKFSDRDIGELVAYLQTVAPVDRSFEERRFGPMARVAALMAASEVVPATTLDHDQPHPGAVERAPTVEFGAYLANGCVGCHGEDFSGAPPSMGATVGAANLTPHPTTGLGGWSLEDFQRALRTGVRPDGTEIDEYYMPWPALSHLTEPEIEAIWVFLRSLEPVDVDRRGEG